jgi:predicted transcriptional regulator
VVARPGIDLAGIAAELDMNRETLRYHLVQLESAARIVVMRNHGIVRYYENHGRFTPVERMVLQHLWNPTASRILSLISSVPGIPQAGIAAQMGITAPTVRWYVQRFEEDGLLVMRHKGRFSWYELTGETAAVLSRTAGGNGLPVPVGPATAEMQESGTAKAGFPN